MRTRRRGDMSRAVIVAFAGTLLSAAAAQAQLREVRQVIYGMD